MTAVAEQVKEKPSVSAKQTGLIAIVRIRGTAGVRETIGRTLKMLNLHKKNWCVVVRNTPEIKGMVIKSKDYCTFGEIDNSTLVKLLEKRGRISGNKPLTEAYMKKNAKIDFNEFGTKLAKGEIKLKAVPGAKVYFKLKPPTGGFERGGTRTPYSSGGALGYRGKEISKLIKRML